MVAVNIKAHPTKYADVWFRSRLEAKWAAFFDVAGWPWSYEPLDLNGWVPDFLLKFAKPMFVEVKPALTEDDFKSYAPKIDEAEQDHEVLLVGVDVGLVVDAFDSGASIGMLREISEHNGKRSMWWASAYPFRCSFCDKLSFCHSWGGYNCRVSGCYEGDHHHGGEFDWPTRVMRDAHNRTQWRPGVEVRVPLNETPPWNPPGRYRV